MSEPTDKMISRALGRELRRARENADLSRAQLVAQLPPPGDIGDRSLLAYEHGNRVPSVIRWIHLGRVVGVDGPTLMARGLQRAQVDTEKMTLTVDLKEALKNKNENFDH